MTTWEDATPQRRGDASIQPPSDSGPLLPSPAGPPEAAAPGLAALHEALARVVAARGLQALTVVVDDPDLGRQAFRAGPGPFEAGALGGDPGWRAEPPLAHDALDGELLVALCAASLRVEVLRDDVDGPDALELSFRRLPGVTAVVVERDDDALIVQLHAGSDAPADLSRTAARLAAAGAGTGAVVVVEIVTSVSATSMPSAASGGLVGAGPSASAVGPSIVAVRSVPEAGEIEVHVRSGESRTIGRAPMAEGLAGAAGATIDALHQLTPGLELGLAWARTIETTADRRFVVAVALYGAAGHSVRHGLGAGSSPIEGAARGALDAALRTDDAER